MKKKSCKKCKLFTDAEECPLCKGNQFTLNWKGRLYVLDFKKSSVAQKIGLTANGEYAIKVS